MRGRPFVYGAAATHGLVVASPQTDQGGEREDRAGLSVGQRDVPAAVSVHCVVVRSQRHDHVRLRSCVVWELGRNGLAPAVEGSEGLLVGFIRSGCSRGSVHHAGRVCALMPEAESVSKFVGNDLDGYLVLADQRRREPVCFQRDVRL